MTCQEKIRPSPVFYFPSLSFTRLLLLLFFLICKEGTGTHPPTWVQCACSRADSEMTGKDAGVAGRERLRCKAPLWWGVHTGVEEMTAAGGGVEGGVKTDGMQRRRRRETEGFPYEVSLCS